MLSLLIKTRNNLESLKDHRVYLHNNIYFDLVKIAENLIFTQTSQEKEET